MYTRKNWVKHWDFIVFDLIMLEISFLLANFIRYRSSIAQIIAMNHYIFYAEVVILLLCFFMTIVFDDPYKNILKNDGPLIYIKDPGPIFYTSQRVGKNGKVFKMYKFRSMYKDADQRKAELMSHNKMGDGMMFKMDDDPRIIGSEKKDKNGKPKGIGNFIRKTSLDEFPQFFNVLKREWNIIGTIGEIPSVYTVCVT